jgi:uncharacterized protein
MVSPFIYPLTTRQTLNIHIMTDIKLTLTERLILANQYKILANIDNKFANSYEVQLKIVEGGFEGLYPSLFEHISETTFDKSIVEETYEILEMYRNLEPDLSNSKVLGSDKIKFQGFDANNDGHYIIMSILTGDMGLYGEYDDFDFNSHSSHSLKMYRKLLPVYKSSDIRYKEVTEEQIQELVNCI